MSESHITKASSSIGIATILSRILGYIRDMVIANYFGANLITDAFYIAYRIPNLLRRIVGEGALSSSFVPIFTEYLTKKTKIDQENFFKKTFTLILSLLIITTLLGIIFTPQILYVIAPGFAKDPERFKLTVNLTRIMFPFMIAVGISAIFLGMLNSLKKFFIPAVSPCFLSIGEISFVFLICPLMEKPIYGLSFGVIVGIFLATIFQYPFIVKSGYKLSLDFNFAEEGLKKIGKMIMPATISYSVDQINSFVDVWFATWLISGSVSALYYSSHLMQFPLAVFGTSIAMASLPMFSEKAALNDMEGLKSLIKKSLTSMFFMIIPSSVGLMVLGRQIIIVLFQHGKFDELGTKLTYSALFFYSIGIFAFAGVKIFIAAFYSVKDSRTPVIISFYSFFINFMLNYLLMKKMGVGGLALASSIASIFNLFYLAYLLRKKIGKIGLKEISIKFIKVSFASFIMGMIIYLINNKLFINKHFLGVAISLPVAILFYISITKLLRVYEYNPFYALFKIKSLIINRLK